MLLSGENDVPEPRPPQPRALSLLHGSRCVPTLPLPLPAAVACALPFSWMFVLAKPINSTSTAEGSSDSLPF